MVLSDLKIQIFADGADLDGIKSMYAKPWIKGFTTNPTLMRKAGVEDYKCFAQEVLACIQDRPISFEVFADDFDEMEAQAHEIASWGQNISVKIPITNTKREFAGPLIRRLSESGIPLNITAVMTVEQVQAVTEQLTSHTPAIVSVFAGRVADTGIDPVPLMQEALAILQAKPKTQLLWASPREILNVVQADQIGCHIITVTNDLLGKLTLLGKDHAAYSLETVEMFYRDAAAAGYNIPCTKRTVLA
jgi:transaldolase